EDLFGDGSKMVLGCARRPPTEEGDVLIRHRFVVILNVVQTGRQVYFCVDLSASAALGGVPARPVDQLLAAQERERCLAGEVAELVSAGMRDVQPAAVNADVGVRRPEWVEAVRDTPLVAGALDYLGGRQ